MAGSEDGKKGYAKSKDKLQAHVDAKSRAAREAYEADPKVCPTCNRVLPYEERYKKFCNQSCSARYNNRGVTRHTTHAGECANCGKRKEKRHNKYCAACIEIMRLGPKSSDEPRTKRTLKVVKKKNKWSHLETCFQCGELKERRANKYCDTCIHAGYGAPFKPLHLILTDRARRDYLIRTRGYKCELCGLAEWRGKPIALELDHINGDPDINTEENLRVICPNCHAQTETYKGKGAGYGRYSKRKVMRRQRYKDGKSY